MLLKSLQKKKSVSGKLKKYILGSLTPDIFIGDEMGRKLMLPFELRNSNSKIIYLCFLALRKKRT